MDIYAMKLGDIISYQSPAFPSFYSKNELENYRIFAFTDSTNLIIVYLCFKQLRFIFFWFKL